VDSPPAEGHYGIPPGTLALLIGRLTSAATTLVALILVGHLAGAPALGTVGVGLAVGSIAAILSDAGASPLFIREGSRNRERTGQLFVMFGCLRAAAVPLALGAVWLVASLAFPAQLSTIIAVALGLILQQAAELTRSAFMIQQRVAVVAAHLIVEQLIWIGLVAAALLLGWSLSGAFFLGAAVLGLSTVAGVWLVLTIGSVRPALPDARFARNIGQQMRSFAAFSGISILQTRIDVLLIGALAADNAIVVAGAYFGAVRLLGVFEFVPATVAAAIYPRLTGGPAQVARLLRRPTRVMLQLVLPLPFVFILAGNWIMGVLFGPSLRPYGWILAGLAALLPARFLLILSDTALTALGRQRYRVFTTLCSLGATVAVNAALLSFIGILAAVLAAVVSTVGSMILYGRELRRLWGRVAISASLARSVIMLVPLFGLGLVVNRYAAAPVGAATFVVAYGVAVAALRLRRPTHAASSSG